MNSIAEIKEDVSIADDNSVHRSEASNRADNDDCVPGEAVRACLAGLLPHHLAELRASGLTDETIRAAGIYSVTEPARLAAVLNWTRVLNKMVPALVYPYIGADGANGYARVKPDTPRTLQGGPIRYESPKGQPNRIYVPAGTHCRLSDANEAMFITEGEKKTLALAQLGRSTIGLVGVYGWKEKGREALVAELARVEWRGRNVLIVFDSDVQHNPQVLDAETRLAAHLRRRGACVKVVRLPDGPADAAGNPTKLGVDDFLVAHGEEAFQELLDQAKSPAEPTAMQMKRPARSLDPCCEVQAFLNLHRDDGVCKLRAWRGSYYEYGDGYYQELSKDDVQGRLVRHLNESATDLTTFVISNHMMQLRAQTDLPSHVTPPAWIGGGEPPTWPADEILACHNQLIHLPSLVGGREYSQPATPRFFTPVALDYDFNLGAEPPRRWLDFLRQLWPNDPQSIALLQEWFGYCLTLDTRQQKILMIVGPRRSGKGTIARVQRRMVGERNVAGPTLSSLADRFGLESLLGKSIAVISDARLGGRTDGSIVTERLLSISGEDSLSVDRKYSTAIETKLDARLMLLSNELPRFSDVSGALAGRMIILRMSQSWFGREDPGLFERLEPEMPGILLWAIEGWHRLRRRGHFVIPASSQEVQDELEDLTSPVGAFVRQRCEVGPELSVARNALYDAYRDWCQKEHTFRIANQSVFGREPAGGRIDHWNRPAARWSSPLYGHRSAAG